MLSFLSEDGMKISSLLSNLTNFIRLGREETSLYIVKKIHEMSFMAGGKFILTKLIHRFQLIFLQDISLGNYHLWPYLVEWIRFIKKERTKIEDKRDLTQEISMFERIVRHLCRSVKSRTGELMKLIGLSSTKGLEEEKAKELGCWYPIAENLSLQMNPMMLLLERLDLYLKDRSPRSISYVMEFFNRSGKKVSWLNRMEKVLSNYISLESANEWKKDLLYNKDGLLLYFIPLAMYLFGSEELELWEDCNQFGGTWMSSLSTEQDGNPSTTREIIRTPLEWKKLEQCIKSK